MDNLLEASIDKMDDLFFVFTPEGEYLKWNESLTSLTGYTDEDLEDLHPTDLIVSDDRTQVSEAIGRVVEDRVSQTIEVDLLTKGGERIPYEVVGAPIADGDDVVAVAGIARDVTERRRHLQELRAMAEEIRELSMPIVEVWDGILLSTVIGRLDSDRAERFTEDLLETIVEREAEVAILDITEVTIIDTHTAQHLIDTIQAVRLLGSRVIITGLKPDISQTLVRLGIGLDVETSATLSGGLETALEWVGASID